MKHILVKTDFSSLICYRKLVNEIYLHFLIMTTSVELPAKRHFNLYMCCDQYMLQKKYPGLVLPADILIYCFDSRKQSG